MNALTDGGSMHSLEFNYLHDLATANYDLGNRPDPDSESIILKEDLLEQELRLKMENKLHI